MTGYNKVFLDTAPLIYFLDSTAVYGEKVRCILEALIDCRTQLVTSAVTVEEYLVYPYRTHDIEKVEIFKDFLSDCDIRVFPIDFSIADRAAHIRADYDSFKAMDSLQLAAACALGCDLFLTNDKQLRQFKDVKCITVDDWENECRV